MDALTQLIEAFVSVKANPMTDAISREGMMRAARSLRRAYEHSEDVAARQDMCIASVFGGMALANAGSVRCTGWPGRSGECSMRRTAHCARRCCRTRWRSIGE